MSHLHRTHWGQPPQGQAQHYSHCILFLLSERKTILICLPGYHSAGDPAGPNPCLPRE